MLKARLQIYLYISKAYWHLLSLMMPYCYYCYNKMLQLRSVYLTIFQAHRTQCIGQYINGLKKCIIMLFCRLLLFWQQDIISVWKRSSLKCVQHNKTLPCICVQECDWWKPFIATLHPANGLWPYSFMSKIGMCNLSSSNTAPRPAI